MDILAQSFIDFTQNVTRVCGLHEAGTDIGIFRDTVKELCGEQIIVQYVSRVGKDNLTASDYAFMSGMKKIVCDQVDAITEKELDAPEIVAKFVIGLASGEVREEPMVVEPVSIKERIARVIKARQKEIQTAIICFDCLGLKPELEQLYPWGHVQDDPHITLVFLGDVATLEHDACRAIITGVAEQFKPISGVFNGIARFAKNAENDNLAPVVALFDAPGLPKFRQRLVDMLPDLHETHGFTPHTTIAYSGADNPPMPDEINIPMIFDKVSLWWGSEHDDFPLVESAETTKIKEAADILRGELDAAVEAFTKARR